MALSNEELAQIAAAGVAGGKQLDLPEPFVPGQQGIFSQGAEKLASELGLGGRRGDLLGRLFGNVLPPSKKQKELERLRLEGKAQKRTRARQGAVQEFSAESGISPQGVATGAGFDTQLRGVLEATARGEVGGREGLIALAQQGPRPTAAREAALGSQKTAIDLADEELLQAKFEGVNQILDREGALNERFLKSLKQTGDIVVGTQQLAQLLNQDNALASLGATIKLAKLLDPNSAVREGEVTTVSGGSGTAASIVNAWNKMKSEGFGESSVNQFKLVIQALAGPEAARGIAIFDDFEELAGRAGADVPSVLAGAGFDRQTLEVIQSGDLFPQRDEDPSRQSPFDPGQTVPFDRLLEVPPIAETPSSGAIERGLSPEELERRRQRARGDFE